MKEYKELYSNERSPSNILRKLPPQKYFFPNHMLNMSTKEYNEFLEYLNAQVITLINLA